MHPITTEFDTRKYFELYSEGYGDGFAMTFQKKIRFVWCHFQLKYWTSEKVSSFNCVNYNADCTT